MAKILHRTNLVLLAAALLAVFLASGTAFAQQPPDYKLHAGDHIEISVWKEEDLQRTIVIRPDGKVTFPLAGELSAAGRTVSELQAELVERLTRYIPEPVVTVSVTGIEGNNVYVIGQVTRPGAFVMNPHLNVLQALSLAGGTTPYASLNDIIIVRGGTGRQQVLPFRYSDVSRGRNLELNVQLEAGDVVIVP